MVAIIIMAIVTARYSAVHQVLVAVRTVRFTMDFIKLKSRESMQEILLVPATVAINALITERADLPAGRVTGAATQTLMEPVQRPVAITGMRKGRFLTCIMALIARIGSVTVVAHMVYFFVRFIHMHRFVQVMAISAILMLVTVNAPQPEQIDMFLMIKSHHWRGPMRRCPDFHLRNRYDRVRNTNNVR